MTPANITTTHSLLSTGVLPGWLGVVLAVVVGGLVVWQLRVELARRPYPRLRRGLSALRLTVVLIVAWLLCQPLLVITRRWTEPGQVVVAHSARRGMEVRQAYPLHTQLDLMAALEGRTFATRNANAARLADAWRGLAVQATTPLDGLRRQVDAQGRGLPPGPDFAAQIVALNTVLDEHRQTILRIAELLPTDLADDTARAALDGLRNRTLVLATNVQALGTDSVMAGREAPAHPDLLVRLVDGAQALCRDATALATDLAAWQDTADRAWLATAPDDLAAPAGSTSTAAASTSAGATPYVKTRAELAERVAPALARRTAERVHVDALTYATLDAGLKDVVTRSLHAPIGGLVLVDDGSQTLSDTDRRLIETLHETGVTVHTVLTGVDGEEPADIGLLGVETPGFAVLGQPMILRAWVKNRLPTGQVPRLQVTLGTQTLADLAITGEGETVVETRLTFDVAGSRQVVVHVVTPDGQADAWPGNETAVTTVQVFAARPRIMIVGDRPSRDFALYRGVAASLPGVDVQPQMADATLGGLRVGGDDGMFPDDPAQWQNVALLVLLGDAPTNLADPVLASLKTAMAAGLPVLLQAEPALPVVKDASPGRSWATLLGVPLREVAATAPRTRLAPRADLWPRLYDLAADHRSSRGAWAGLPSFGATWAPATPGLPLVAGGADAPLQLVVREGSAGLVLVNGLTPLAALRDGGQGALVNRLVAELLVLGMTPWHGADIAGDAPGDAASSGTAASSGERAVVRFPRQPVAGSVVYLDAATAATATSTSGLTAAPNAPTVPGLVPFQIAPDASTLRLGGTSVAVTTPRDANDFRLAAHAAPLRDLATLGGGTLHDLTALDTLADQLTPPPAPRERVSTWGLWRGWWPLILILACVTSEYLLRRQAGRVM